jgi:addiction module HigA family antidote
MDRLPPIHPGEVLREDFMKPTGLTVDRLANSLGIPSTDLSEFIAGQRPLTSDLATRLARHFGTSEAIWLRLQARYDAEVARMGEESPSLDELVEQIAPENRHPAVDWGPAVGKEIVDWVDDEGNDPSGPQPG